MSKLSMLLAVVLVSGCAVANEQEGSDVASTEEALKTGGSVTTTTCPTGAVWDTELQGCACSAPSPAPEVWFEHVGSEPRLGRYRRGECAVRYVVGTHAAPQSQP